LAPALPLGAEDYIAGGIALRTLNGNGSIAEVFILEDPAYRRAIALRFLKVTEELGDFVDMLWPQFLALAAEALSHLLPEAAGVDELNLALARIRFSIADNPDVRADAGVIEHVRR
jgi:hypothetical protein